MIGLPLSPPSPTASFTLGEAIDRYIQLRADEANCRPDTFSHLNVHLKQRLAAAFGSLPLRDITPDHIRTWVRNLVNPRTGKPFDPLTARHHIIDAKTFFKRCHGEGWIARDPSLVVARPAIEEGDVNIMPVKDAFHFFKVNRDARAIGRVALEAFGGCRYTTAGALTRADLKFDRRGIEMPSSKHKSKKRKFRQGQPENCWLWLEHAQPSCWEIVLRQYRDEKKEMLVTAGLRPWILKTDADREKATVLKNVWRHSFASYLLAKMKNYGPVAYLMQHAIIRTTEVYEGTADEADARLYFAITPKSVEMTWEEFAMSARAAPVAA